LLSWNKSLIRKKEREKRREKKKVPCFAQRNVKREGRVRKGDKYRNREKEVETNGGQGGGVFVCVCMYVVYICLFVHPFQSQNNQMQKQALQQRYDL